MKRYGNLYHKIYDMANLDLAERRARRGKSKKRGVVKFNLNREENLRCLQQELINKTYKTSPYTTFILKEEKERLIFRLPYKDRVLQHAVLQVIGPILQSAFTADTYSCIKRRGVHKASYKLRKALRDEQFKYVLKFDIRKYFPSVNGDVLKAQIRRKIKDVDVLELLDGIIDSAPGLPVGNYLSQLLGNFYLTPFDHWIKEQKRVVHYWRYTDDCVILAEDKPTLHALMSDVTKSLQTNFCLEIKPNWRIFPVELGIDFGGYVHFRTHVLLRKSIKKRYIRMMKYRRNKQSIGAYNGWLAYCDSKNLVNKIAA